MTTLRWQPLTTLLLSIYGLGASIYLTITHFEPKALACVSNSTFNCEKVTQSPQSEILGIPVAMLGLGFFVPMVILCLPVAWRSANRWIHIARLALSVTGIGMIIYLISAELFIIKAICLWCSSVHIVTLILFMIIATASPIVLAPGYGEPDGEPDEEPAEVDRSSVTPGAPVADHRPGRPARLAWGAVVVILLGVVGLVTYALTHVASPSAPAQPAVTSPAVLATLSSVPATTFDAIGVTVPRTTLTAPTVASVPALPQVGGKPQVLFVGAEFCPFCAAERWPLVVALARFGKFTALHDTASSSQAVFPGTPSFSFVGVAYSSPWVSLSGVELYSDETGPDGAYIRLDRLTPAMAAVVSRATPEAAGVTAGTTPFLDVAGRLSTTTSGYSPALLAGQSQAQIADAVADPQGPSSPPTGQAIIAVANQLSAGICAATSQVPACVCRSKGVLAADTALGLSRPDPLPAS